ncbi:MAG: YqgE/AlgH family protein [Planctomycetaceae bacterium]|nr:YqgE/AlgH family protein [Planctomycetaceae bacterium]
MQDLTGHLLVAAADMEDPQFARTVVLLIRHNPEDGAMGLVLNRPISISPAEIFSSVSDELEVPDGVPVCWGGPVQGPLVVMHTQDDLADLTVMPGVCISTQRDRILELLRLDSRPYCFYLGYSGWGKQQLEGECELGGWHTSPATPELIFADPYDMWSAACGQVSWQVMQRDPRLAKHKPSDPNLN